jgi:hypothetical protein
MTCQQASYHDPMHWCQQRVYGRISPGSIWTRACYHHFQKAARKGWLVER